MTHSNRPSTSSSLSAQVARLIRLVRFSRMNELIGHIAAFFRSGMFPTIMGIFKIMTGMMIFWHLLACVWYRLAAAARCQRVSWKCLVGVLKRPKSLRGCGGEQLDRELQLCQRGPWASLLHLFTLGPDPLHRHHGGDASELRRARADGRGPVFQLLPICGRPELGVFLEARALRSSVPSPRR